MRLKLITAPRVEPVSLAEVKRWCKVDLDLHADDATLTSLITDVRQEIDGRAGWLGRALCTQTWDLYLDRFPRAGDRLFAPDAEAEAIVVPLPPLQSVTSITYVATDGTSTTLSSSLYSVDIVSEPGRIVPAYGQTWPSTRDQVNAVIVRFVAGYGTAAQVPEGIKTYIKAMVAHLYAHREPVRDGSVSEMPMHGRQRLDSYWMPHSPAEVVA